MRLGCRKALNVEVVPRETQTVPARTTHWSADKTVAKGCSLFTNMFTCQRETRIEYFQDSKTDAYEAFFPCLVRVQSRCLPSLGMNWSEPSSVSWSSVKMSTMLGLELGFELGLLRRSIMSPLLHFNRRGEMLDW